MNIDLASSPAVLAGAHIILKWLQEEIAISLASAHQEIGSLQHRMHEYRAEASQRQKELESSLRASERHLSFVQANERKLIAELTRVLRDVDFFRGVLGEVGISATGVQHPTTVGSGATVGMDTRPILVCDEEWRSLLKEVFSWAESENVQHWQDHHHQGVPGGLEGLWTGDSIDAVAVVKAIKNYVWECLDEKQALRERCYVLERERDELKRLNASLRMPSHDQTAFNNDLDPDCVRPQCINPSQLLRAMVSSNGREGEE